MGELEEKLQAGEFFCIKDNKNQLLSLKDLNKKHCYTKCVCDGDTITCKFLDYKPKGYEVKNKK